METKWTTEQGEFVMVLACRYGKTEPSTKASGKIIKRMVREHFGMRTATTTKVNSKMINQMVTVFFTA